MYWEYDHALYLYPLPHALVLADASPAAAHHFDTCACINPVSECLCVWGRGGRVGGRGEWGAARACPACCRGSTPFKKHTWVLHSARCGGGVRALPPTLHPRPPPSAPPQGSLAAGTFGAYNPVSGEVEVCDVQPAGAAEAAAGSEGEDGGQEERGPAVEDSSSGGEEEQEGGEGVEGTAAARRAALGMLLE